MEGDMEIYLTIAELAGMIKLSGQTIRRYVLNKTIPYHKIQKAVRFRLSEIETWIDGGGMSGKTSGTGVPAGDLFGEGESGTIAGEVPLESAEPQAREEKPHE
jgi:excisionase family DNA binding protein